VRELEAQIASARACSHCHGDTPDEDEQFWCEACDGKGVVFGERKIVRRAKMKRRYRIISVVIEHLHWESEELLARKVEEHLNDGWELVGGVCCTHGRILQAICKVELERQIEESK
jgi:hypothetical protein